MSSRKKHRCPSCGKTFDGELRTVIDKHMEKNVKCRKYLKRCQYCSKAFLTDNHLSNHLDRCESYKRSKSINKARDIFTSSHIALPNETEENHSSICQNTTDTERTELPYEQSKTYDHLSTSNHHLIFENFHQDNRKRTIHRIINSKKCTSPNKRKTFSPTSQCNLTSIDDLNQPIDTSLPNEDTINKSDDDESNIGTATGSQSEENVHDFSSDRNFCEVAHHLTNDEYTISDSPSSVSELISKHTWLETLQSKWNKHKYTGPYENDYLFGLETINYLMENKMSLHKFQQLSNLRVKSEYQPTNISHTFSGNHQIKNPCNPYSLNKMKELMAKRVFGSEFAKHMKPIIKKIPLHTGRQAVVVHFDVFAKITDILNDEELVVLDNLVFRDHWENDRPFHIDFSKIKSYGDIETTDYYKKTYADIIKRKDMEILCPVAFFIDSTNIDKHGRLNLEPIVIVLLIFNRNARNTVRAWRVIGYIQNLDVLYGHKSVSPDAKAQDYHNILSFILQDFHKLQNSGGQFWTFRFKECGENGLRVKMHFPIHVIIGDAKGNDMLAGRYGNYNTNCICRDCDVTKDRSDETDYKCTFIKQSDISSEKDKDKLKTMSFRPNLRNAFRNSNFGSNEFGINGATPPEPLHLFYLGLCKYLPESFYARISDDTKKFLETESSNICTLHHRQSDRSLPFIRSFRHGIQAPTKLSAQEKYAQCFALYLCLLTSNVKNYIIDKPGRRKNNQSSTKIDDKEYRKWQYAFEQILIFGSWLYAEEHPKKHFSGGHTCKANKRICAFLKEYKKCVPRETGNNYQIVKFHQHKHWYRVIPMFGSLKNIDGGIPESHQKEFAKYVSRHTQKRNSLLDIQTADQVYLQDLCMRAFNDANKTQKLLQFQQKNEKEDFEQCNVDDYDSDDSNSIESFNSDITDETHMSGKNKIFSSRIIVTIQYSAQTTNSNFIDPKISISWENQRKSNNVRKDILPNGLVDILRKKFQYYGAGNPKKRLIKIVCAMEMKYKLNETQLILRCTPSYRRGVDWYDWVNIQWEEIDGDLPGQILLFVLLDTAIYEDIPEWEVQRFTHGYDKFPFLHGVIVHSAAKEVTVSKTKAHNSFCSETNLIHEKYVMEDNLQIVGVESIKSPAFVIVDSFNMNLQFSTASRNLVQKIHLARHILVIKTFSLWKKYFIKN